MDWNRVQGNWKQVKGLVKEKWGKLTDDDLTVIDGRRDGWLERPGFFLGPSILDRVTPGTRLADM